MRFIVVYYWTDYSSRLVLSPLRLYVFCSACAPFDCRNRWKWWLLYAFSGDSRPKSANAQTGWQAIIVLYFVKCVDLQYSRCTYIRVEQVVFVYCKQNRLCWFRPRSAEFHVGLEHHRPHTFFCSVKFVDSAHHYHTLPATVLISDLE